MGTVVNMGWWDVAFESTGLL